MYVGLDVHKRFCYGTIMNEKGEIVKDGKFSKDLRCLDEFMKNITKELATKAFIYNMLLNL